MANNKVQLADGTVLIDITDTTAVASDVAAGKYFYGADGVKTLGTGSGGGGETEPPMLDVDFIDYDGTLLYSYSAADFLAMDALPANPSHDGLTAQGWNWTLADAKTYVQTYGALVIGQNYVTTNGKTKVYLALNERTHNLSKSIYIYLYSASSISGSIDWGDGNTTTFSNKTGSNQYSHQYSSFGDYVIQIASDGDYYLGYNGSNRPFVSYGMFVGFDGGGRWCTKIEIGSHVVGFCRYAFSQNTGMKSISIPTTANGWMTGGSGGYAFGGCSSLTGLVFPNGVTTFPVGGISDSLSLRAVSFPKTVTVMPVVGGVNNTLRKLTLPPVDTVQASSYLYALEVLILPGTYTSFPGGAFRQSHALKKFTIPASVTSMSNSAVFGYDIGIIELHCLPTSPPPIANTLIRYLPSNCVIYVPYSADHSILNAYKKATNWSVGASKMVEEGGP